METKYYPSKNLGLIPLEFLYSNSVEVINAHRMEDKELRSKILCAVKELIARSEADAGVEINGKIFKSESADTRNKDKEKFLTQLKQEMDRLELLLEDDNISDLDKKMIATNIISMTAMYDIFIQGQGQPPKEHFNAVKDIAFSSKEDRLATVLATYSVTHERYVYPGEPWGLDNLDVVADLYNPIYNDEELLKQWKQLETAEERGAFLNKHVELIGVFVGGEDGISFAHVTEETPFMLMSLEQERRALQQMSVDAQ